MTLGTLPASSPLDEASARANVLSRGLALIREYRGAFLILNVAYFALVILALIYTLFDRSAQQVLMDAVGKAFGEGGPLGAVGEAYGELQVFRAVGLTFALNLFVGSFASITLPSLIIPFSGLLVAAYRAVLWGILFAPPLDSPLTGQNILLGAGLVLLLLMEGEAYVLATFGAYLQGRAFLWPKRSGAETRWRGYVLGLKQSAWIYVWVVIVLLIAAFYEVWISALGPSS